MASLLAYTAFARAYELGSFSAVARELGLTQSTVSKHRGRWKRASGCSSSHRAQAQPTRAALLYEGVQHLLDAADAIQSSLGGPRAEPSGLLRPDDAGLPTAARG